MADYYNNFSELKADLVENTDYRIVNKERPHSDKLILAIHGGGIETGTSEIADGIAKNEFGLYKFEGLWASGNSQMHITSVNFDEPKALHIVKPAKTVISVHGYSGDDLTTYIGGLDTYYMNKVQLALEKEGFAVAPAPTEVAGTNPNNLANRNIRGAGVQLELTTAMRQSMFGNFSGATNRQNSKNSTFYKYVNAIRYALYGHENQVEILGRRGSYFF